MTEPLHGDCVACLAQNDPRPAVPVLTVLRMLQGDAEHDLIPVPLEQIVDDLCVPHRRMLNLPPKLRLMQPAASEEPK